jgi:pimeloyl-ACP methyl ester carboxylesterase
VESEKLAYDYMLRHAMEINDKSAVRNLEKFDRNATDFPDMDYMGTVRSLLMNKYGIGIMRDNFSMGGLIKNMLFFQGYTLSDKINFIQGIPFSNKYLWDYVVEDNLFESSSSFKVPVYITHGKYDYQVSYALASKYFEIIEAPEKLFFTFEKSAHSPNGEEPEKFTQTIRDIALQLKD